MFIGAQNVSLNYQNTIGSINLINNAMTVRELKEKLNEFPENMDVFLINHSEFKYGLATEIYDKIVNFSESPNSEPISKDMVIIIEGN